MSTFPAELTGTWEIDNVHSTVGFTARHAMVATTRGHFANFTGAATINVANPESSSAWLEIETASVTTGNGQRDEHLRSGDFFQAEDFPKITFRSTGAKVVDDTIVMSGDLTIRDRTAPIEVSWEFQGLSRDPWGATKAGFDGTATVNRKEWGLNWNAALEAGGVLVSDKIKLVLEIAAKKAEAPAA
jgi:polyisoprenoid-binding protein YceI